MNSCSKSTDNCWSHPYQPGKASPKVNRLWNLHNPIPSAKLDFFVVMSSISSLCRHQDQANYSVVNSFLDTFVRYHWNQGLSALVLNLGIVSDIGCIPKSPKYLTAMCAASVRILNEKEVVNTMEVVISQLKYSATKAGSIKYLQIIVGMSSSKPLLDPGSDDGTDSFSPCHCLGRGVF